MARGRIELPTRGFSVANVGGTDVAYMREQAQQGRLTIFFAAACDLDEPAFTITATHRNNKRLRMGDGRGSRFFTTGEIARLQAFPDDWRFVGSEEEKMRQIGNAVPPPMAAALMAAVARALA